MNDVAAAEQIVNDRIRQKLNQLTSSSQSQLSSVQHHINFTLQQAYFKCAYECFDSTRQHDEISNCVEHCSVPVLKAQNFVEGETSRFRERLQRLMMLCQDDYETSKNNPGQPNALSDYESCLNQKIDENIDKSLPNLAKKLERSFGI